MWSSLSSRGITRQCKCKFSASLFRLRLMMPFLHPPQPALRWATLKNRVFHKKTDFRKIGRNPLFHDGFLRVSYGFLWVSCVFFIGCRRATNLKTRFQVRKPGFLDKTPENPVPWQLPALKQALKAPGCGTHRRLHA